MLEQKLYVLPDQKLVYLSNAKAGCSTLKASLWRAVSPDTFNPDIPAHDRRGSPFSPTIKAIAKDLDEFRAIDLLHRGAQPLFAGAVGLSRQDHAQEA